MSLEIAQKNSKHPRIPYIDTMKAWAILCVVMGHIVIFNLYGADNNSLLFGLIYSFHLPLFAFASGLVTNISTFKFQRRIKIIIPLFLFGIPYTYIVGKDFAYFLNDDMKCGYWWLWLMAMFYICLYLMHRFKMGIATGFILFEVFFQILSRFLPPTLVCIFCVKQCTDLWPWLCCGMLAKKYNLTRFLTVNRLLPFAIGIFWMISFLINGTVYIKGFHYIISLLGVLFFTSLFRTFCHKYKFGGGRTGQCTLQIYVLHYYIIQLLPLKGVGAFLENNNFGFLDFIICPTIAIPICWLCIVLSDGLQRMKAGWAFGN